jgi:CheY-like chemotaxis protein
MNDEPIHILLADDDSDDCFLFGEALGELPLATRLSVVNDGEQLMQFLTNKTADLPLVIFLDLNMPRKNGMECLLEIKKNKTIKHIPVIMYSTSAQPDLINMFYKNGAHYYIRKPAEFPQLKKVIHLALQSIKENFAITRELNARENEDAIFNNGKEIKT